MQRQLLNQWLDIQGGELVDVRHKQLLSVQGCKRMSRGCNMQKVQRMGLAREGEHNYFYQHAYNLLSIFLSLDFIRDLRTAKWTYSHVYLSFWKRKLFLTGKPNGLVYPFLFSASKVYDIKLVERVYYGNWVSGDMWPFDNVSFCCPLFLELGNDFPSFNFDSSRCIDQFRELPRTISFDVKREPFFLLSNLDIFFVTYYLQKVVSVCIFFTSVPSERP